MVKVSEVVPFKGICAAPKALVMEGGVATVKLAEAVLPVPPLVEVTAPVVLVNCPDAVPVTVTLNWHWPFAAMVRRSKRCRSKPWSSTFHRKPWRKRLKPSGLSATCP